MNDRKTKTDILFLCQFFYPEYNSSASLPFDIAKHLADIGFSVGVLCGYPKEYSFAGNVPKKETVDKINIKRLKYLQLDRKKRLGRMINYFSFTLTALLHIFSIRKYRSVIVFSNPPILPLAALTANVLFGTKIVFVSFDVYPEVAYASKSLDEKSIVSAFMRFLNKKLFRRVSTVVALTDEMKRFLLCHRPELSEDRIVVIPNWAHESKAEKSKSAYGELGYSENSFVVSYFGNMGVCQDVETMLRATVLLKDEPNIKFLIAGHGSKLRYVTEATRDLPNVTVKNYMLGKDFENALSVSSLGIVSLENGLKGTCAPSKYYSYLQSGIPVLAIAESTGYLTEDVRSNEIGEAVEIGDAKRLAEIILDFYKDREKLYRMSENAKRLYSDKYAKEKGTEKYGRIFDSEIGL